MHLQGRFVGAMTGTSVDGLDLALVDINGSQIRLIAAETTPLPESLRSSLLQLIHATPDDEVERLGHADTELGRFTGESIRRFIERHQADDVIAIGSHGQTIRHRPSGQHPFTLQIGDPNCIAEHAGITTVADFRRRDVAAGGQGAPLVPPFHAALFAHSSETRVIANIGGIANITVLAPDEPVIGYDTGPGNALMDAWCAARKHEPYDRNGAWAASGGVDDALLERFLSDAYFREPAPKSTGKERYNLNWLEQRLVGANLSDADVQHTLAALTAEAIAREVPKGAERVIVCGGGRLNPVLMRQLTDRSSALVEPSEVHGVDGDALEAAAFAWLAYRRINKLPANLPSVTGAEEERVLGGVYAP